MWRIRTFFGAIVLRLLSRISSYSMFSRGIDRFPTELWFLDKVQPNIEALGIPHDAVSVMYDAWLLWRCITPYLMGKPLMYAKYQQERA